MEDIFKRSARKRRARKHLRERRMRRAGWGGGTEESGRGNGKSSSLPQPVCAPISSEEEGEL